MVDNLIKFFGLSHLINLESRDQLGNFIPVGVFETNKIFFELRGVNNSAVPPVKLREPSIEVRDGLA